MFVVTVLGMTVMGLTGTLSVRDVVLCLFIGCAALGFLLLLVCGHLMPGTLQRGMRRVERAVAALARRLPVHKEIKPWADKLVHSFSSASTKIVSRPRVAVGVFGVMVLAMLCDMAAFMASCVAFGIVSLPALLGAYATALVFNSCSPTPGGVGFVEGLSSAVLASYGHPAALALSAVLTYRCLLYWVPFAVGGVMMRVTGAFGSGRRSEAAAAAPASGAPEAVVRTTAASVPVAAASTAVPSEEPSAKTVYGAPLTSLRLRVLQIISTPEGIKGLVATLVVALAALCEMVVSALPRDPAVLSLFASYLNAPAHPLIDPLVVIVFAYLLLLCCSGLLIQDQGCWLFAVVLTAFLGAGGLFAGNGLWAGLVVLMALVLLVLWHTSFTRHSILRRMGRLVWIVLFGLVVAVLYSVVGMLILHSEIAGQPDLVGTLVLGLRSLVVAPDYSYLGSPRVVWFAWSAYAVARTLILSTATCIVLAVLHNRRARKQM